VDPLTTAFAEWTTIETHTRLSNDKALNALSQALSPSKFSRISYCETAQEAWAILETTYEGTKIVNSTKLQMLVSQFEGIKMQEDEPFNEFYTKISDLRNSMVSLEKKISDAKLIKKILRSLPDRFRIKVTSTEESKDLDAIKIEELWSLQTYEFSLPPVKKAKYIALKIVKEKSRVSSNEDIDEDEGIAMIARNFKKLMKNQKFENKFFEKFKNDPMGAEQDEANKKDPKGPRCYECSSYGHIRVDFGNLNTTLNDDSKEEET